MCWFVPTFGWWFVRTGGGEIRLRRGSGFVDWDGGDESSSTVQILEVKRSVTGARGWSGTETVGW